VQRILRPISYVLAAIYLCVDFVFARIAAPVSNWIARRIETEKLRAWIRSLSPYPCLALFSVPVIVLEPVKFLAAYMATTGRLIGAGMTFVAGELLKLVLVERLFDLTREQLMRIAAFAWIYGYYARMRSWIVQIEAVQAMRSMSRSILRRLRTWWNVANRHIAWDNNGR
jgi:hypothetical protein